MDKPKQTKSDRDFAKAAMLTKLVMQLVAEGKIYMAKDVAYMQERIKELEAEIILLRTEQPEIPDHANIRGKEYYK